MLTTLRRGITATGTTTALRVEGTIKLLLSLSNRKYILFMVTRNEKWETFYSTSYISCKSKSVYISMDPDPDLRSVILNYGSGSGSGILILPGHFFGQKYVVQKVVTLNL